MTMSDSERAGSMVKGKHSLTLRGIELACDFLGPIVRSSTTDARALAAVAALEAACEVRRRRSRGKRRS